MITDAYQSAYHKSFLFFLECVFLIVYLNFSRFSASFSLSYDSISVDFGAVDAAAALLPNDLHQHSVTTLLHRN